LAKSEAYEGATIGVRLMLVHVVEAKYIADDRIWIKSDTGDEGKVERIPYAPCE
jgi:hypothetical protein